MVRKKTVSVWTFVNKNIMNFINPFYQKDDEPIIHIDSSSSKSNILSPMTDYVSISLFKDHFFKWNQEHQLQLQAAAGTPYLQMQQSMFRAMDLQIENSELKKLIKSMCQEMSKRKEEPVVKKQIAEAPVEKSEQSLNKVTKPNKLAKDIKRKQSVEVVYEKDGNSQGSVKYVLSLPDSDENEDKKVIYEEDETDDAEPTAQKLNHESSDNVVDDENVKEVEKKLHPIPADPPTSKEKTEKVELDNFVIEQADNPTTDIQPEQQDSTIDIDLSQHQDEATKNKLE